MTAVAAERLRPLFACPRIRPQRLCFHAPPAPPCSDQAAVRCCNRSAAPTATVSPPYAVSILRPSAAAGNRPFPATDIPPTVSNGFLSPPERAAAHGGKPRPKPPAATLHTRSGSLARPPCLVPPRRPRPARPRRVIRKPTIQKRSGGTPSGAPPPVPTAGGSDLIRHLPYEGPHALHLGLLFELAQRLHHGGHLLVLDDRQHRGVHGRPGV